jgi:hypothetical protein
MTPFRAFFTLMVALLAGAAPASAATVHVESGTAEDPYTLVYTAAAGEQNKVSILVEGSRATIDDPGADPLTAGARCTQVTPKRATCDLESTTNRISFVRADLGDGDDTWQHNGAPATSPAATPATASRGAAAGTGCAAARVPTRSPTTTSAEAPTPTASTAGLTATESATSSAPHP